MVTMNQGVKEVRETGSRFIHRLEAGVMAAYDWVSGPAMTDMDRHQHQLAESDTYRIHSRIVL